ncbi:probable plastid-lipid-associated protein 11, chloroplastic isoform X1 [Selaginella moellendorffii]|uniref:probable plastid-lipid-associated protein 11, chloroplastic isoform X1 n=1 Tax=Selaginella moellendorffii TaxID=88036 RepID=UPI000D1CD87D|nr:probable plastid-lipid-associated protein 11, chloroplastic isoform X1 [Selaginella moellendorffii]|eukprot:XP_024540839.1 probable plastid-lipid-associated protein 11, chloroplastic isoform X1 [Selaginella moellendorffii]
MAIISHSLLKYFEIELKTLTAMVSLGNISTPATIFPTRYAAAAGSSKHQCRASIATRDELLGLISDDERGLRSQKDKRRKERILRAFEALAAESASSDGITTDSRLSGTWRMLWTTEKEQLFIVDKAPLFGTRAGDILQVIDVGENRLNNVITFPPSGAFVVASTMEVVSDKRVEFQLRYTPVVIPLICSSGHRFTGALLRSDTWSLPVPPFGKGWFESVYLDEHIRLAKDIRGDFLVVERAPYDWIDEADFWSLT